MRYFVIDP